MAEDALPLRRKMFDFGELGFTRKPRDDAKERVLKAAILDERADLAFLDAAPLEAIQAARAEIAATMARFKDYDSYGPQDLDKSAQEDAALVVDLAELKGRALSLVSHGMEQAYVADARKEYTRQVKLVLEGAHNKLADKIRRRKQGGKR